MKTVLYYVRFEVFTAVTMKKAVFWDVAPCRNGVNRRFGGTYRFHLQDRREIIRKSAREASVRDVRGRRHIPEYCFLHSIVIVIIKHYKIFGNSSFDHSIVIVSKCQLNALNLEQARNKINLAL
jgi:hypothetical protein